MPSSPVVLIGQILVVLIPFRLRLIFRRQQKLVLLGQIWRTFIPVLELTVVR